MSSSSAALHSAKQLHQAGQIEQALGCYQQVLELEPRHAEALGLLGLLYWQLGRHSDSVDALRTAIDIDSSQPSFFANLGEVYRGLGQWDEAIACYLQVVRFAPQAFEAHNNLATLYQKAERLDEAVASYKSALKLAPQNVELYFNLGTALQRQGNLPEAYACYERVMQLKPDHVRALINLGGICKHNGNLAAAVELYQRAITLDPGSAPNHYNLGNVLQMQGAWEKATACYRRALALHPDYVEVLCNLGSALQELMQLDESLACLRKAIQLQPELAVAHCNLGVTLQVLSRFDEARACLERAVELEPRKAEFLSNLGTVLMDQGDLPGAIALLDRALQLEPNYAHAQASRGIAYLSVGDYLPGWAGYEHRIGRPQYNTRSFPEPLWDGSPLAGRTLLIHCEQGFGDTLQFIRYAQLVQRQERRVIVAAQGALLGLLAQSGVSSLTALEGTLPKFDVHAPLMSLPHIFRTELDTVPCEVPYLATDPERIETWRAPLAKIEGFKVGIAWQGRTSYRGDRMRSIPLSCFEPLARVPEVRLIGLQKGFGSEQIAALAGKFEVIDLARELDNSEAAFIDTAAVMHHLDLVVSCDTGMSHLAGGLGVRAWVAIATTPDWRWLRNREDSPWYPSLRLFRQTTQGNWSDVFQRMAEALRNDQR